MSKNEFFNEEAINKINSFTEETLKNYFENIIGSSRGIKDVIYAEGKILVTFEKTMDLDVHKQDVIKTLVVGGGLKIKSDSPEFVSLDGVGNKLNGSSS